jgi:hypothetical protein
MAVVGRRIAVALVMTLTVTITAAGAALQKFNQPPTYREVNPGGRVVLPCLVANKQGECRWEKDGTPVGMYKDKYEWDGKPVEGDCSLRVLQANIEYDNGVWQCQVTASDFTQQDTLISEGAELVVRGERGDWRGIGIMRMK